jgi:hypothetical protein
MWDTIFFIINHFSEPYKKKDLSYLINSRLKDDLKKNLILSHDIVVNGKCSDCKDFRPWVLVNNNGEGIFLLKKIIEKFSPWVSFGIQKTLYDLKYSNEEEHDGILIFFHDFLKKDEFYNLLNKNEELIIDSEIRITNYCQKCHDVYPWILIKSNKEGFHLAKKIKAIFDPYITIKLHKYMFDYHLPNEIKELYKWNHQMKRKYGKLFLN